MRKPTLERKGDPAPNGVGAIRVLSTVGPPLREEVIAFQAPSRFSYKLLSGMPVRDHVGTVELDSDGDGTKMVYAVRTMPTLPLIGGAVIAVVKQGIQALIRGISTESEWRAANG